METFFIGIISMFTVAAILLLTYAIIFRPMAKTFILRKNRNKAAIAPPGTDFTPSKQDVHFVALHMFFFMNALIVAIFILVNLDYQFTYEFLIQAITTGTGDTLTAVGLGIKTTIFGTALLYIVRVPLVLARFRGGIDWNIPELPPAERGPESATSKPSLRLVE